MPGQITFGETFHFVQLRQAAQARAFIMGEVGFIKASVPHGFCYKFYISQVYVLGVLSVLGVLGIVHV